MKLRHSVIFSRRFEVAITEYEGNKILWNVGKRFPGDVVSHIPEEWNPQPHDSEAL